MFPRIFIIQKKLTPTTVVFCLVCAIVFGHHSLMSDLGKQVHVVKRLRFKKSPTVLIASTKFDSWRYEDQEKGVTCNGLWGWRYLRIGRLKSCHNVTFAGGMRTRKTVPGNLGKIGKSRANPRLLLGSSKNPIVKPNWGKLPKQKLRGDLGFQLGVISDVVQDFPLLGALSFNHGHPFLSNTIRCRSFFGTCN